MLSIIEIISIILIHTVADFILQDDKWAFLKGSSVKHLLIHTATYSVVWYFVIFMFALYGNHFGGWSASELGWSKWMALFPVITFIFHTATDYVTSKINAKRFKREKSFTLTLDYDDFRYGDVLNADMTGKYVIVMENLFEGKYLAKVYNKIPNFGVFTFIQFDQVLHYIQLFLTYYLLKN